MVTLAQSALEPDVRRMTRLMLDSVRGEVSTEDYVSGLDARRGAHGRRCVRRYPRRTPARVSSALNLGFAPSKAAFP